MTAVMARKARSRIAVLVALALTLVAVSAASAPGATQEAQYKLVLETGVAPAALEASVFVAEQLGLFGKYGLEIEHDVAGTLVATNIASGKGDAGRIGASAMLPPKAAGKDLVLFYRDLPANTGMGIVVRSGIGIDKVEDLAGRKMGSLGVGSVAYGAATLWNKYLVSKGLKPMELIPLQSAAATVPLLASGQIDAAGGQADKFVLAIQEGKQKMIINGYDKLANSLQSYDVVGSGYFALREKIDKNRGAFVRFVAGLREAMVWMKTASNEQVAQVLKGNEEFKDKPLATIRLEVEIDRRFWNPGEPTDGLITKKMWKTTLDAYAKYDIPGISVDEKHFSYKSTVDRSIWDDATKLMAKGVTNKTGKK